MTGLNIEISKKKRICLKCSKLKDINYYLERDALPVWYDEAGVVMYTVPKELKDLSNAEKLLIQRVSPMVPLHHIKKGTMGLSGHVCVFEQDVNNFLTHLPRACNDIAMLRIMKTMTSEIGNNKATKTKAFRVRRKKIMEALLWLKKYNTEYSDILIDEKRLDWFTGEEGDLEGITIESQEDLKTGCDDNCENSDMGPIPQQTKDILENGENIQNFGFVDTGGRCALSKEDEVINSALQEAVKKSSKKKRITVDWPAISNVPVNEYGEKKSLHKHFPGFFLVELGISKTFQEQKQTGGK